MIGKRDGAVVDIELYTVSKNKIKEIMEIRTKQDGSNGEDYLTPVVSSAAQSEVFTEDEIRDQMVQSYYCEIYLQAEYNIYQDTKEENISKSDMYFLINGKNIAGTDNQEENAKLYDKLCREYYSGNQIMFDAFRELIEKEMDEQDALDYNRWFNFGFVKISDTPCLVKSYDEGFSMYSFYNGKVQEVGSAHLNYSLYYLPEMDACLYEGGAFDQYVESVWRLKEGEKDFLAFCMYSLSTMEGKMYYYIPTKLGDLNNELKMKEVSATEAVASLNEVLKGAKCSIGDTELGYLETKIEKGTDIWNMAQYDTLEDAIEAYGMQ